MTEDTVYIERRLRGLRASKRRFYITFGAAVVLGTLCLGLLVFSSIDLHVSLRAWLRAMFFGLLVFGALVLLGGLVVIPILRRLGVLKLSWDVEEAFPTLEAALATTVEYTIDPYSRTHHTSDEMKAALAGQTRGRIADLKLRRSIRWARLRWPGVALAVVLIGLVSYLAFVPSAPTAVQRMIAPWKAITYTRLSVQPGDVERQELSDLTVTAELKGRIPEAATIHFEDKDGEWVSDTMPLKPTGSRRAAALYTFTRLERPFSYFVEAGDAASPKHTVIVYPDPKVDAISAELVFPAYTELPKQVIGKGDILALRGTRVTLAAKTNTVLGVARLVWDDGTVLPLTISDDKRSASGSFVVESGRTYEVYIEDTLGHRNRQRKTYEIVALKDTVPDVRIIHPGKDMKVTKTSEVPIEFEVADDFGIEEVGLALNVRMEGEQRQVVEKFDTRTLAAHGETVIMLESFPLEAHDIVSYYVYAIDNDTVSGPKQGLSNVYFLEVVPYEEKYRLGDDGAGMPTPPELEMLYELIRVQKDIVQQTFGVLNSMTEPVEPDVKERVLGLASLQLGNAELAEDFAVTLQNELLAAGMESEIYRVQTIELAAKYMRTAVDFLESVEPQAATGPEQQALAALYKALTDIEHLVSQQPSSAAEAQRREQIRQALELAQKKAEERAQERQREREEKLNEQESKLEELKERQHELNEEMAEQAEARQQSSQSESSQSESQSQSESESQSQGQSKSASSRQRQLSQETDAAAQNLDEMAKKDPSLSSKASSSAEKASDKMQEAAEQLDESKPAGALEEGLDAEKHLEEALEQIEQAKQRNLAKALEQLARDLDEAAREQGDLESETAEAEAGSNELANAGERQEALKDAVDDLAEDAASIAPRVSDEHPAAGEKVSEASEKLSSGEIQKAMEKAAETMSGGDGSSAQPSQEQARQGLRDAANLASEALRAMSKTDKEKLLDAIATAKEALSNQRGINRDAETIAADPAPSPSQKEAKARQLGEKQADVTRTTQQLVEQLDELGKGDEYKPQTKEFREAHREMDMATRYLDQGNLANASASGELAAERLAKGLDELEKLYGKALLDDLAQAVQEARRLEDDQERVRDETTDMKDNAPTESARARTALRQKWVRDDAEALEGKVGSLVEQARTAESDARERLAKAKEALSSDELDADLAQSREDIEADRPAEAAEKQARALGTLDEVQTDLERAYKVLTTSELERLWESAERLGEIGEQLDKMREGEPTDEQTAQLAKELDEEAENLSDTAQTEKAREHVEKAGDVLGESRTADDPVEERERIEVANEQIQQAVGELVKRIDVLVKARKILLPKDETCPPEYRALVEYYYKVLSEF